MKGLIWDKCILCNRARFGPHLSTRTAGISQR